MKNPPYVLGGGLMLVGYLWAMLHALERTIPEELMELRRQDQMHRLKGIIRRLLP
jgi:hypothetical protein